MVDLPARCLRVACAGTLEPIQPEPGKVVTIGRWLVHRGGRWTELPPREVALDAHDLWCDVECTKCGTRWDVLRPSG